MLPALFMSPLPLELGKNTAANGVGTGVSISSPCGGKRGALYGVHSMAERAVYSGFGEKVSRKFPDAYF